MSDYVFLALNVPPLFKKYTISLMKLLMQDGSAL